jgi:trigger factor
MKVETNEIEYCKVSVLYTADKDIVLSKTDEAVAELRKVNIPGFRKGRAPDYAIRSRCKNQIKDWVAREMAAQAYDDMVFETNMKPIGMPEYKTIDLKENDFSCEMIVLKKPEFELKPYGEYEVERPDLDVNTDSQVEASVENLRLRLGDMLPYEEDDVVERGDQITMSFNANIDGDGFDGSTKEGELYVVGENIFPDFDDYIIGMKADEEREFDLVLPEEITDIGGKTATFKVTVHMGTKKKPCEINADFFEKVGAKDMDELKAKLKVIAESRVKEVERDVYRQQISQKLVEDNDFQIPDFLRDAEARHLAMQGQEVFEDLPEDRQKALTEIALKNVRLSLILDSLREEEPDAVLNDQEAQEGLAKRVIAQGGDPKKFLVEAQKNGSLIGMISALRDEFALQWVIKQAKIIEKEKDNAENKEAK